MSKTSGVCVCDNSSDELDFHTDLIFWIFSSHRPLRPFVNLVPALFKHIEVKKKKTITQVKEIKLSMMIM